MYVRSRLRILNQLCATFGLCVIVNNFTFIHYFCKRWNQLAPWRTFLPPSLNFLFFKFKFMLQNYLCTYIHFMYSFRMVFWFSFDNFAVSSFFKLLLQTNTHWACHSGISSTTYIYFSNRAKQRIVDNLHIFLFLHDIYCMQVVSMNSIAISRIGRNI